MISLSNVKFVFIDRKIFQKLSRWFSWNLAVMEKSQCYSYFAKIARCWCRHSRLVRHFVFRQKAGNTLDKLRGHHKQPCKTLIPTFNLESPVNLTCSFSPSSLHINLQVLANRWPEAAISLVLSANQYCFKFLFIKWEWFLTSVIQNHSPGV